MEQQGGAVGRGDGARGGKTRRSWSAVEEEVLLRCMKEIVSKGWKMDNGFRAGYLNRLEGMMVKAFPGTDLKAMPHINSKVHVWKDYGSLVSMIGKSGIGLCCDTNMIDATNDAWAQYIKVDGNARLMRFKAWPMFSDWVEVFRKDRATGEAAEDVTEAAISIQQETTASERGKAPQDEVPMPDLQEVEGESTSVFIASAGHSEKACSRKKRKYNDENSTVIEVLGKFLENTEKRLSKIAR